MSDSSSSDEDEQSVLVINSNVNHFSRSNGPEEKSDSDYGSTASNEESARPRKMPKMEANPAIYSDKSKKLMLKMGWNIGEGLGPEGRQGRVEPVEQSKQKGRLGLGHTQPTSEWTKLTNLKYDASLEHVDVIETCDWLINSDLAPLKYEEFEKWFKMGERQDRIDDQDQFCDSSVLEEVLAAKTALDDLDGDGVKKARSRSNPFETIKNGIFLNRAAMKMANMDKAFDFMFTDPKDINQGSILGEKDLLYFADVCAGPGGFSEYVFYRKKWLAKGFGFTLRGENDFKLSDFYAGPCESFEAIYGVDNDGDVYKTKNIQSFVKHVKNSTEQKGVHFMMADGGFCVDKQENLQEIFSKQLYLCQFLVALCIVRPGGHFVCKVFDLFTPFSVGLIYLLYKSFISICIFKPNSSRPANSERYLICKCKRDDCDDIMQYMFDLNNMLNDLKGRNQDIIHIVPLDILKNDESFFEYIYDSNNKLGKRQVVSLQKLVTFYHHPTLNEETRQTELRQMCLQHWDIPDTVRISPHSGTSTAKISSLLGSDQEVLNSAPVNVDFDNLSFKRSTYDWMCYLLAQPPKENTCTFYLGLGRNMCYRKVRNKWEKEANLKLSPNTLVYGEMVTEVDKEGHGSMRRTSFYIIDGITLGDTDIRHMDIHERRDWCRVFAKSLNMPSDPQYLPIKVKELFELHEVETLFKNITERRNKNNRLYHGYPLDNDVYYQPSGILFLKKTHDNYMRCWSKGRCQFYHFDIRTQVSFFDDQRPRNTVTGLGFIPCFKNRLLWKWNCDEMTLMNTKENKKNADKLVDFVRNRKTV